ncbi:MAG TPA: hypothetical protein VFO38_01675, partial [Candidatus Saccharimonadales bacterium]|nr:hypothetical protein [Candidatus Saccharimonadales bacterium]
MFFMFRPSYAAELTNRTITVGTSVPSAVTTHRFNFDLASGAIVGSIELEYCENSPLIEVPCIPPPGLNLTGATLGAQNGETGFSIHPNSTATKIILTRTPAAATPQ